MRLTIQLCTYKRPQLLARVLEACFEQTVPATAYIVTGDGDTGAALVEHAGDRV